MISGELNVCEDFSKFDRFQLCANLWPAILVSQSAFTMNPTTLCGGKSGAAGDGFNAVADYDEFAQSEPSTDIDGEFLTDFLLKY